MDVSETYIKQCDCEEIQCGRWYKGELYDLLLGIQPKPIRVDELDNLWYEGIWLPRLDQLQAMVGGLEHGFIDWVKWLGNIYGFNYGDKPNGHLQIFSSWEQLWLAFVMSEKFGKIWSENSWVDKNP